MAQFRELEAFAQFSSDLDPETKKQIDLGARLVEILKQPQYQPMSVGHQVAVIYAVSNGFASAVEVTEMQNWEAKFHEYFGKFKQPIIDRLSKGDWDEAVEKELKEACADFAKK